MLIQQAWNSCPLTVAQTGDCLSTVDWRTVDPFNTKMTISERRASAVFNRFNFTITDVIDLSDPTPTDYAADDFFVFYKIIFAVNESNINSFQSTQYLFLTSVASYLRDEVDTQLETGTDDRLSRLQEFLAVPVVLFNNINYGGPTFNMGKSVTLATPSYRVPPML